MLAEKKLKERWDTQIRIADHYKIIYINMKAKLTQELDDITKLELAKASAKDSGINPQGIDILIKNISDKKSWLKCQISEKAFWESNF